MWVLAASRMAGACPLLSRRLSPISRLCRGRTPAPALTVMPQAALQWKASKAMPFQTAMRRENRPSKQHLQPVLTGRGGGPPASQLSFGSAPAPAPVSLPVTPAEAQIRAVHAQRAGAQLATPAGAGDQAVPAAPGTAAAVPSSADPALRQWRVASAGGQPLQAGQAGAAGGQRQVASAGGRSGAAASFRCGYRRLLRKHGC